MLGAKEEKESNVTFRKERESLTVILFLLGITVLLSFVGPVHLSVKGRLISSTLLLLKNVSGPYPKKSSTTSVTPAFPHLFALMAL